MNSLPDELQALVALAHQVVDDEDWDSVADSLHRLGRTAESLELGVIAAAAGTTAENLGTLSVAELVNRIDQLLVDAQTAEEAGDTTTAGVLRGEAISAVGQLEILLGIADPLVAE